MSDDLDALFADDPPPPAALEPPAGPKMRGAGRMPRRDKTPPAIDPLAVPLRPERPEGEGYGRKDAEADILQLISTHFKGGGKLTRPFAKEIRRVVLGGVVKEAVEQSRCQFPDGLGVLKVIRMAPIASRRMPDGRKVVVDRERLRLRFVMGVTLKRMLGYGNDYKYVPKRPPPDPETPPSDAPPSGV